LSMQDAGDRKTRGGRGRNNKCFRFHSEKSSLLKLGAMGF
jgi:hypothetical protein